MALFKFHLDDGSTAEAECVELADLAAARMVALQFVGQLLQDQAADFWKRGELRLMVSDEANLALFSIHVVGTEAPSIQISVIPTQTS